MALQDGLIDMIATDHAPHAREEKKQSIEQAPFGLIGLETSFPLMATFLVKSKKISLKRLIYLMATSPRQNFGLTVEFLPKHRPFEGFLVDWDQDLILDESFLRSKSSNTPFLGKKVSAIPKVTFYHGRVSYQDPELNFSWN